MNTPANHRICLTCYRDGQAEYKRLHRHSPVRKWAIEQGYPVGTTGTLPARIFALYEEATR